MKTVLVPVDGSESSNQAIQHLIKKRANYRDPAELEIHLLNVQHPVPGDVNMFIDHEELKQFHHDEGLKALQQARELLDKAGARYTFHVSVGDPAEIITHYAKEKRCDQIIMGTHGKSDLAGFFLGSVTHKVIHLTEVPVLLVK